jgi:hypothetical protein
MFLQMGKSGPGVPRVTSKAGRLVQPIEQKLEKFSEDLNSLLDSIVGCGEMHEDLADRLHAKIVHLFQQLPDDFEGMRLVQVPRPR